jgi:hypothetical protein
LAILSCINFSFWMWFFFSSSLHYIYVQRVIGYGHVFTKKICLMTIKITALLLCLWMDHHNSKEIAQLNFMSTERSNSSLITIQSAPAIIFLQSPQNQNTRPRPRN